MKKFFGLLMCAVVAFAVGCGDTKKKTEKKTEETTKETKETK